MRFTDKRDEWFRWGGYSERYHLWVGHLDRSRPVGLVTWFHGDGGYEFDHPDDDFYLGGRKGVLSVARSRNMALLVPNTPQDNDGRTWWEWAGPDGLSGYAAALINDVMARYGVDSDRVVLCGFSGGAEFLSHDLLRDCGDRLAITGGAQIMIGGGTPPEPCKRMPDLPLRRRWACRFIVGEHDVAANAPDHFDAVDAAVRGEAWWRDRGWDASLRLLPDRGHLMGGDYGRLVEAELTALEQSGTVSPSTPRRDRGRWLRRWVRPTRR